MATTYILSAEMDQDSFSWLDDLRRRHFPPERNFLPAHLTLFHRLSADQVTRLSCLELPSAPIELRFERLDFLGFGVAVDVRCAELARLRDAARTTMGGEVSRQDSEHWRPHVTVQNKVPADAARRLHRALQSSFSERAGTATGLIVWEYLGGPWKLAECLRFEDTGRRSVR